MKYFSTFTGIGGFELGIQRAFNNEHAHIGEESEQEERTQGRERPTDKQGVLLHVRDRSTPLCVGYSEIDKYATKVYNRNFEGVKNYGDITQINAEELPDFDLLVGGFPCQAFSVAGKRQGFDDTRGTLFFDIARILAEKRPRHLVLENVKGLLSHDSGKTFTTILKVLSDLGYRVEWMVLNSKDFGVPQNRERVFIVGHLRGEPRPEVFPIAGTDSANIKVNSILDSETWKKRNESIRRVYDTDGISPTIPTGTGGGVMPKIVRPVITPDRENKRQNGRRIKDDGEPSFTLTSQDLHGVAINEQRFRDYRKSDTAQSVKVGGDIGKVIDNTQIRRLTPLERERLQAFPDNWTKYGEDEHGVRVEISDSQRYKMCGNAVTTNVIEAVFSRLRNYL